MSHETETENEYAVSSPITPSLAPMERTNTSETESDIAETRAAVQCASGRPNASNGQLDTQSFMDSPSSTNSSNNDTSLTREARANLNDESYIQQQEVDLQRIRHFEVYWRSEYERADSNLAMEKYDEPDIEEKFENVLAVNKALLSELKELKDAKNRIDAPWRCEHCTFINEAYRITRKDICEICEAPSPKKKHELLHR